VAGLPTGGCSGGGMYIYGGAPVLTDVTFRNNQAPCGNSGTGGGLYNSGSTLSLTDAVFISNKATNGAGGMYSGDSDATLTNVLFVGNDSPSPGGYGGGLRTSQGNATLINVVFSGNRSGYLGGALYATGDATLVNVSINGNKASYQGGGGIRIAAGITVTATNSILWDNNPSQFEGDGTLVASDCIIQGGYPTGTNILDVDPQFVTPVNPASAPTTAGNLRLILGSPGIDSGDNSVVTVLTDLNGLRRIINSVVDLGAYEKGWDVYLPVVMRDYP